MRALVVGVDGNIGAALARALDDDGHEVTGTTRRDSSPGPGRRLRLHLSDPAAVEATLPPADIAFFCAAMARFTECREQPELSRRVNVSMPLALARRLVAAGSRVVLLSTSAVFDGHEPFAAPDRPRRPASAYGMQKAEAEECFLALGSRASVLRLTKVVTSDMPLFRAWFAALRRGEPIEAFADLTLAPVALDDAVTALMAIAESGEEGIFQVSGTRDVSYHEVACWIARQLCVSECLVSNSHASKQGIPASEILPFTTLDASRTTALTGRQPPDPWEVFARVFQDSFAT